MLAAASNLKISPQSATD